MIRGVIFDMDGLLVDTETLHCQGYIDVLANYNYTLTPKEFFDYWTRGGGDIVDFVENRGIDADPEQIRQEKIDIYLSRLEKELRIYEGADEVVASLAERYPLAVVTNSFRTHANQALEIVDLRKYFKIVLGREDVHPPKPAPDGFLWAANIFVIPPENMVVIEDAEKGIRAAHAAGMKSIAVPSEYTKDNDFSLATVIVDSIKRVDYLLLDSL